MDDMGNMKLDIPVATIISKGRHYNVQLIFLAHLAVDLNPKSRNNVKEIYITTGISNQFFKDLKDKCLMQNNLSNFNYVEYGIIKYNLYRNTFIGYDKDF
ncbi:MAG: hypothetical protein ACWIPJ_10025 [Polaribacter sp.]